MNTAQRIVENLLLVTHASRALLQLARPGDGFAIEAEAVQHGQQQIRNGGADTIGLSAQTIQTLASNRRVLVEHDIEQVDLPASGGDRIRARMLAPVITDGQFAGVISLHRALDVRWSVQDEDELLHARVKILGVLAHQESLEPAAREDLRSAATQAILDRVRTTLDVHRCTFRQPVQEAFSFPVTFESRADGQRSLLGDFTIVQIGQPVIVKLLEDRKQVVQEDCRVASSDPLFHKMLAHYGGMLAQVVTPFIVGDQLKGVLSVHELRNPRSWTNAEKALAAEAAALIGTMFEMS